jgi:membrane-bound lytic murein transglycosylase D
VFYRTKNGDSLSSIAEAFKISRADLLSWNAIDPSARLQSGMLMQVLVTQDYPAESLGVLQESQLTILVAGSPEFGDYFEGLRGYERIVVQAKQKDTLASIGAKYGVSVGMMERINRRSRRDALVPGESVVVYTRRGGSSERVSAAR